MRVRGPRLFALDDEGRLRPDPGGSQWRCRPGLPRGRRAGGALAVEPRGDRWSVAPIAPVVCRRACGSPAARPRCGVGAGRSCPHLLRRRQPRSAASTMLVSSMARVIGPTPPTGGAREPATWSTSGWTSPKDALDGPGEAHGQDGGARLDPVGLDQMGHAGRGHHHVGDAGVGGGVLGGLVAQGHRGVFGAAGEHQAERTAHSEPAADDAELLSWRLSSLPLPPTTRRLPL